jgi:hypothetical protein
MRPWPDLSWLAALRGPQTVLCWSLEQWDHRVRLARRTRLLGRLAESVLGAGLAERLPEPVANALLGAARLARARSQMLLWCRDEVAHALQGLDAPIVLLKGAAYMAQALPNASGRLPSDLDILVPARALSQARERLLEAGWTEVELDEHDQQYYREWSHELPPMRHPMHAIELDLHHNILPPVARDHVDAGVLLKAALPLPMASGMPWWVLSKEDQVLHCAAHLFHDSEHRDRLRDLVDLEVLLGSHAAGDAGFGSRLVARARDLGVEDALMLGATLLRDGLGVALDPALDTAARQATSTRRLAFLANRFAVVLAPRGPDDDPAWPARVAESLLLARYHWRRLPLPLLMKHTWHKWRVQGRTTTDSGTDGL